MTLREIFNGIKNLFSNSFNSIIDFDLTNTFLIICLLIYVSFIFWLILRTYTYFQENFNNWGILKKIGHLTMVSFLYFWLIFLPIILFLIE